MKRKKKWSENESIATGTEKEQHTEFKLKPCCLRSMKSLDRGEITNVCMMIHAEEIQTAC